MSPPRRGGIIMVLPASEGFAADRAGAIALVARRLALAAGATVIGRGEAAFPEIDYIPQAGRSPLIYGANVLRRLRALRPDHVEIHQQPRLAALAARLLPGARVMLHIHNDPLTMRGLRSTSQRSRMLATLHRVVCVSDYLARRYATNIAIATASSSREAGEAIHGRSPALSKLTVLPNPLTLAELPAQAVSRAPILLFAGRIVENKGVADFIAACAACLPGLPGWRAVIIGGDRFGPGLRETPYVIAMRQAANAAGIEFQGYRPHAAILSAMAEASIVVVPSRWPEPFGLTALEAIASGAALIATATGGLPEVVGDAGILVPPGHVTALTEAMVRLAIDPGARKTLAIAGCARAQQFDTSIIAARLQALRGAETRV